MAIKIKKAAGTQELVSAVKWPSDSRLSAADKAAVESYTRDVQIALRDLISSVQELQKALDGKTLT